MIIGKKRCQSVNDVELAGFISWKGPSTSEGLANSNNLAPSQSFLQKERKAGALGWLQSSTDLPKSRNSPPPIRLSLSQGLTPIIWPPQLQLHFQTFFFWQGFGGGGFPSIPSLSNGSYFLDVTAGAQINFFLLKKKHPNQKFSNLSL